jgi:hypothetical protein
MGYWRDIDSGKSNNKGMMKQQDTNHKLQTTSPKPLKTKKNSTVWVEFSSL